VGHLHFWTSSIHCIAMILDLSPRRPQLITDITLQHPTSPTTFQEPPSGHHCHAFHQTHSRMSSCLYSILISLVYLYDRLRFASKTRGYCTGVGGKDTSDIMFEVRQRQLFKTIVSSTASTTEKRGMISSKFINMKTRGKAVSIGPLEYCGNGIPLKKTNKSIL